MQTLKKVLLISVIIGTASAAHSQGRDTVCLPIGDALQKLELARQAPVLKEKVAALTVDIETLQKRIIEILSQVNIGAYVDSVRLHQLFEYQAQVKLYQEEKVLYEGQLKKANRDLRRQRRKTKLVAFAGLAAAGGLTYFYITK